MKRTQTRQVWLGKVAIGGGAPITIQSMTNTDTRDVAATVAQIRTLAEAGCEIVRCTVPDMEAARALKAIRAACPIPLVADVHFDHRLAMAALENGADKVRINPGNIGGADKVRELVACAKDHGAPIRIGVNGGSLEKELYRKYGGPTPEALVQSALSHVALLEGAGFYEIVISLKASDVETTVAAYEGMAQACPYPLHLGITEAGGGSAGLVKSAAGLGILLHQGLGDTLRISLTGEPVQEVEAARQLLRAMGLRKEGVEIVSCPTCGRTGFDLLPVVRRVEAALPKEGPYLKVAVMGCAVNGPGEARDADVGVAFAGDKGLLFQKGKLLGNRPREEAIGELIQLAKAMLAAR